MKITAWFMTAVWLGSMQLAFGGEISPDKVQKHWPIQAFFQQAMDGQSPTSNSLKELENNILGNMRVNMHLNDAWATWPTYPLIGSFITFMDESSDDFLKTLKTAWPSSFKCQFNPKNLTLILKLDLHLNVLGGAIVPQKVTLGLYDHCMKSTVARISRTVGEPYSYVLTNPAFVKKVRIYAVDGWKTAFSGPAHPVKDFSTGYPLPFDPRNEADSIDTVNWAEPTQKVRNWTLEILKNPSEITNQFATQIREASKN